MVSSTRGGTAVTAPEARRLSSTTEFHVEQRAGPADDAEGSEADPGRRPPPAGASVERRHPSRPAATQRTQPRRAAAANRAGPPSTQNPDE